MILYIYIHIYIYMYMYMYMCIYKCILSGSIASIASPFGCSQLGQTYGMWQRRLFLNRIARTGETK